MEGWAVQLKRFIWNMPDSKGWRQRSMVMGLDSKPWTGEGKERLEKGNMAFTLTGKCLRPRTDLQKVLRKTAVGQNQSVFYFRSLQT